MEELLLNAGQFVVGLLALAAIVQGIVEAVTKPFHVPEKWSEAVKRISAILLGVAICMLFQIDYATGIFGGTPMYAWVGYLFSGLLAGIGSAPLHDLLQKAKA